MQLRTPRLRGDRVQPFHFDEIRRMHQNDRVMTYLGGVRDDDWSRAYLSRNLSHWDAHNHGLWILHEGESHEPIGRAVLRHLDVEGVDEVETGYAFYEQYWGRGYATEVTRACLALGFDQLRLSSIVAVTALGNTASQHVLQKCGLHYERTFQRDDETLALFRLFASAYSAPPRAPYISR